MALGQEVVARASEDHTLSALDKAGVEPIERLAGAQAPAFLSTAFVARSMHSSTASLLPPNGAPLQA